MRAKPINGELIYPPNVSARLDGSTVVGYPQREDLLRQCRVGGPYA